MTKRALLFTDLVDSTALAEELGDEGAAKVWAEHDRRARALLIRYSGLEIGRSDGFFLLFDNAVNAANYALAYHREIFDLNLHARVGLHVGPVVIRNNHPEHIARGATHTEVDGLAVPIAARLMALARGRQTLTSAATLQMLADALPAGAEIESHGHYRLKGVASPMEVFELGVRGYSPFSPPPDADKAYGVVRAGDLWNPVRAVRHNLPGERDAFIGRTADLHRLAERLDAGTRLVTVLGPGGIGKTRFVRRYGWTWLGDWPGGVFFCDLSEARTLDGIFFAVASALDVPLGKDDSGIQLGHAIRGRGRCLVILDNFEQLVEHALPTLGLWLDRAANATFLVTSRERLHLPGEEIFPIEPLPLEKEGLDLFAVRAAAQEPDFVIWDANRAAVAEVVRLLEGLPLAIELAASHVRVLSPAQLADKMRDRFRLLVGARGSSTRQSTLKATIDWSWNLLASWEQAALAQCTVFDGAFTLAAAEDVLDLSSWPEAPSEMDAVQALVDKSLIRTWFPVVQSIDRMPERYFGMYVSVREYASEQLRDGGSSALRAAEQRHGRYFASFGTDEALEQLCRHGGVARRRALALALDNIVTACRRAIRRRDGDTAVSAYRAAWEVLELRGPFALGATLGSEVLALGLSNLLRAAAVLTRAQTAWRSGRMQEAHAWLVDSIRLFREERDQRGEGRVLFIMGVLDREQGRMEDSRQHLESALAIYRAIGNRSAEGTVLGSLALVCQECGRMEESQAQYQQALALHRELGNRRDEGVVLGNLGILHREQGRMDDTRMHYEAALAIHREVGHRRAEGIVLGNLGNLHFDQGRLVEARTHYDAALAIIREVGHRRDEGIVLGNLGARHFEHGELDEARVLCEGALVIHREIGNRRYEGEVLGNLGALHYQLGHAEQARALYDAALVIAREVNSRRHEGCVLGSLGELLVSEGRLEEARETLRDGEALLREVGDELELAKLLCIWGQAECSFGEVSAAGNALANAEKVAGRIGTQPGSDLARMIANLREALAAHSALRSESLQNG